MICCPDLDTENQIGKVYQFFESQDDFKWKKFELQSCKSRRKLQVSCKVYLLPSSFKNVTIFFWK
jgi:hypothetical protein